VFLKHKEEEVEGLLLTLKKRRRFITISKEEK